jgi:hypothetical protein
LLRLVAALLAYLNYSYCCSNVIPNCSLMSE